MKPAKVRIANPVPGEAAFTSEKRAKQHVERGYAKMTERGELFFYNNRRVTRQKRDAVAHVQDRHIEHYRSGVVFWNGRTDPKNRHRPGECVS